MTPDEKKLALMGIDAAEGVTYCADDPEFYTEMLEEYVSDGETKLSELQKYYDENNIERYVICVHSLKSTSKMIGAGDLSELARELEFAGRENNADFIRENHGRMTEKYAALIKDLHAYLGV
ncbi:MAG: Hpt domain-containing protein [Clostridia bacterium]|nr:Hpt domain-containing protein [Clostridia bacterium]